jgi:NAD(P)H-flavin reductase
MLLWQSVVNDAYYYERIGFRAAWVSITQVPFVYLLASKASIIGLLSGSSHERLNWLHRWVSRTLLVTATIHGAFFYAQWDRADFVQLELEMMPMVKYGMGAWAILLWTFLSSLTPIRSLSYEIFVLQHLAAAAVFLWLLWVHVPQYAMYNIWFAIAAVSFDKIFMACWTAWANISVPTKGKSGSAQVIGHQAEIRTLNNEMSEVIVHDVKFRWAAGQHIYLRIPSIGPIESHPFTIANAYNNPTGPKNSIQLIVEKKSGFTKRLHTAASKAPSGGTKEVTAIITGPLGNPPEWASFETLILISASTGITFTLPILESILNSSRPSCVRRIDFLQVVRLRHSINPYTARLEAALAAAERVGIALTVRIAVTCETCGCCGSNCQCHNFGSASVSTPAAAQAGASSETFEEDKDAIAIDGRPASTSSSSSSLEKVAMAAVDEPAPSPRTEESEDAPLVAGRGIVYTASRPDVGAFIRRPVEATGGETGVAVCGGKSVVACVRNEVARLSDERGVHKGTGAQGIALFTEHYCF